MTVRNRVHHIITRFTVALEDWKQKIVCCA